MRRGEMLKTHLMLNNRETISPLTLLHKPTRERKSVYNDEYKLRTNDLFIHINWSFWQRMHDVIAAIS